MSPTAIKIKRESDASQAIHQIVPFHKRAPRRLALFRTLVRRQSSLFHHRKVSRPIPSIRYRGRRKDLLGSLDYYSGTFGFVPWVTSLMNNHYHTLGYLYVGNNLKQLMQRLHGSVAKLVNDLLPERRENFGEIKKAKRTSTGVFATRSSADERIGIR